jgi:dihydrofolate reductase
MGKIIYFMTTSLDGFAADKNGDFEWAVPSEEVHAFVNDLTRNTGTFLFGRAMYEIMKVWEHIPTEGVNELMDGPSAAMNDFARIWRAAKKVVYSTTLSEVSTAHTRIERVFNPDAVRSLAAGAEHDFGIGGPRLAAEAIRAGVVDEYHQIIVPQLVGGGIHWLPEGVSRRLVLVDVRKFENGFVHLQYRGG